MNDKETDEVRDARLKWERARNRASLVLLRGSRWECRIAARQAEIAHLAYRATRKGL